MVDTNLRENIASYLSTIRRYLPGVLVFSLLFTVIVGYLRLAGDDVYMCEMEFVPPDFSIASPLLRTAALVPGSASDLERTYGYLQSFSLRQELIDTFNLYAHYGLEKISSPRRRAEKLDDILKENIQIRITKNATISIRVYDTSPDFSYQITLFLRRKVERFCRDITGMEQALAEKERQLEALKQEIRALEAALADLRVRYRIITAGEQRTGVPVLPAAEAFAHYDEVLSMESRLVRLQETYANLLEEKGRREDFLRVYPSPIFIIQPPYMPLYPVDPHPVLFMSVAFVGSFVLGILLVLYAQRVGLIGKRQASSEGLPVPL